MQEPASEDAPRGRTPRAPLPEDIFAPPGSPCERLQGILGVLLAAGNVPNTNGFLPQPDGLVFGLVYPIDFALVRATCDIPPEVVLSEESDSILDRLTWCVIEGPGALAAMRRVARHAGRPWPTTGKSAYRSLARGEGAAGQRRQEGSVGTDGEPTAEEVPEAIILWKGLGSPSAPREDDDAKTTPRNVREAPSRPFPGGNDA